MDEKEYQKRDLELQEQIVDYTCDCYSKEAQIAFNNREITRLEWERKQLYALYKSCQDEAPQRGLDGKIIKK